eukprot:s1756_g4.t7
MDRGTAPKASSSYVLAPSCACIFLPRCDEYTFAALQAVLRSSVVWTSGKRLVGVWKSSSLLPSWPRCPVRARRYAKKAVADLSALDAAAAGVTASTMPSLVEGEGDPEVTLRDLFAGDGSALPTMPRFPEEKVGAASA